MSADNQHIFVDVGVNDRTLTCYQCWFKLLNQMGKNKSEVLTYRK